MIQNMQQIQANLLYFHGLEDDWDGEGALKISPTVFDLVDLALAKLIWSDDNFKCPAISPCNDGSIDFFWRWNGNSILLNLSDNCSTWSVKTLDGEKFSGKSLYSFMKDASAYIKL